MNKDVHAISGVYKEVRTRIITEMSALGQIATGAATAFIGFETMVTLGQLLVKDTIVIRGRSMLPTLPLRCICKTKSVPYEQLKVNDIASKTITEKNAVNLMKRMETTDKDYKVLNNILIKHFGGYSGKQSFVHRIIKQTPNGFITKGDNNASADAGFLTKENYNGYIITGKVLDLTNLTGEVIETLHFMLKQMKPYTTKLLKSVGVPVP